jgi:hypothetical protein
VRHSSCARRAAPPGGRRGSLREPRDPCELVRHVDLEPLAVEIGHLVEKPRGAGLFARELRAQLGEQRESAVCNVTVTAVRRPKPQLSVSPTSSAGSVRTSSGRTMSGFCPSTIAR